jgi:hypothetical protein
MLLGGKKNLNIAPARYNKIIQISPKIMCFKNKTPAKSKIINFAETFIHIACGFFKSMYYILNVYLFSFLIQGLMQKYLLLFAIKYTFTKTLNAFQAGMTLGCFHLERYLFRSILCQILI